MCRDSLAPTPVNSHTTSTGQYKRSPLSRSVLLGENINWPFSTIISLSVELVCGFSPAPGASFTMYPLSFKCPLMDPSRKIPVFVGLDMICGCKRVLVNKVEEPEEEEWDEN